MKRPRRRDDPAATSRAHDLAEFDRRLKELTLVTPITGALLCVNIVVWLAMVWQGVDWLDPSPHALASWGANGPLTAEGQGWRLLTAFFLHRGLLQLIFNQWALYQLGTLLERLVGHVGLILIYLVSGFAAGLASLLARPEAVTAGSTPAITGLLGAVIAYHFRVRGALPSGVLSRLRASVFVFLAWNIGYGIFRQQMDNAGFLAGLATGVLCGLVAALPLGEGRGLRRMFRNALLVACGAALVFFAAYAVRPSPLGAEVARYQDVSKRSLGIYTEAKQRFEEDRIRPEQFVKIIKRDVLPDWDEQAKRFHELKDVPEKAAPLLKTIERSMALRAEAWRLGAEALSIGDEIDQSREASQQTMSAFAAAQVRYRLEKLSPKDFRALIERETLPKLASVQKRLDEQADVPEAFQAPLKTWQHALELRQRALKLMASSLAGEAAVESEAASNQRDVQAEVEKLWGQADDLASDFRAATNQASKDAAATVSAKAKEADDLVDEFLDGIGHLHDAPAPEE